MIELDEILEILENSLGLKVGVEDGKIRISDGKEEVLAEPGYTLPAIALFVEPRKAWSVIRILYGDKAQAKKAYDEYKELPYTTSGKVCWLHKALAKAVNQRVKGADKERVLTWLEDQVYRRWPNVCGEADSAPELTKLVTELNSLGVSASMNLDKSEVELKVRNYTLRLRRRSPQSLKLIKELRKLAKENHEIIPDLVKLMSDPASCLDLAKALKLREELKKYPMIRDKLLESATALAEKMIKRTKTFSED
ncbi:hypothetical protein IPA_03000 [Ignicoccus pacificus DSM 13166]|uniref:Uncharacterized protein n=1 Tax=Ignicoccus pacificus DSM 13166 TaxID=940294 RepID=A0A977PJZ0_9CREN|nr:hypothetical protein IPA_03000 [Ignicoccus pacificus DSM 13166]